MSSQDFSSHYHYFEFRNLIQNCHNPYKVIVFYLVQIMVAIHHNMSPT